MAGDLTAGSPALVFYPAPQVSAPMAPVCRTESVVHNATMAVLLEGMAPWAQGSCGDR